MHEAANFAAQELATHGFSLGYYNCSRGEIDFLVECGDKLLPLMVQSGKPYYRYSAMKHLLADQKYPISQGCIFYDGPIKRDGGILYLPIYFLMFLQEEAAPA